MKYVFCKQDARDYCVAACLQMIFQRRGLAYDSQETIMRDCRTDGNGIHIHENGPIDDYFVKKRYALHRKIFFLNKSFTKDFDCLIADALKREADVMVAYAFEVLHRTESRGDHVSLIESMAGEKLCLVDPDIGMVDCSLRELTPAIYEVGGGFHVMHHDKEFLSRLDKSYL